MNYEPKFIDGMTIEQIDAEIKEDHERQYRYGYSIDKARHWDLEYTKKVLKEETGAPRHAKEDPDDFYKQRIEHLEAESQRQAKEIHALEDKEANLNGVINELHDAIAVLEIENQKLRDEIIRRVVGA